MTGNDPCRFSPEVRPLYPKIVDDLARRVSAALPDAFKTLQTDLDQNFRSAMQAALSRLDLVTREEFDVQAAVLRRTRERLEAMEARIAALEEGDSGS